MKILKFCLLSFAFSITVSLYGNPKESIYVWYVVREIKEHIRQPDGPKCIKRIFRKLSRGEKVTAKDVKFLFPARCCIKSIKLKSHNFHDLMKEEQILGSSGENSVPVKKFDCVLIQFCYQEIPFTLCLKKNGIVVLRATAAGHIFLIVNEIVPSENQLMKYAYEHYDVFTKHLYALLNEHISTEPEVNPFAVQMQSAFEQFGCSFNQTVEPVPCFIDNAENTYAFIRKWSRKQYKKGRTFCAIGADLQPMYELFSQESDVLCARVGKFFQSTVIDVVESNGESIWRVRYFEPRKGENLFVGNLSYKQKFGKHVFTIKVGYLLLLFRVSFERRCGSNREKNYERTHYGYDRMVVKLLEGN